MKELLEKIWKDKLVRCPHNQVWWQFSGHGHYEGLFVWWTRGRKWRRGAYPR